MGFGDLRSQRLTKTAQKIFSLNAENPHSAFITGTLHTDQEDIKLRYISTLDISRDFNKGYSDEVTIRFTLQLGDFVKNVYKYRDNLEVTLIIRHVGVTTTERFKLVLVNTNPLVTSGTYEGASITTLNEQGMYEVEAQCISLLILQMRNETISGSFKDADVGSVMMATMRSKLRDYKNIFGIFKDNLVMVPPNNTRKYEHIIIDEGTKLLDLPGYMQKKQYGVYNGDINTYLHTHGEDQQLYVYPIFRSDLLAFFDKTLMIIAIADSAVETQRNTYTVDGNLIRVVARIDSRVLDNSDNAIDKGVRIESVDSESVFSRPFEITEDGVMFDSSYVKRVQQHKELTQSHGTNTTFKGVSNNSYDDRTEVLRNELTLVTVNWNYSSSKILLPSMPVLYIYDTHDRGIVKRKGMLQHTHSVIDNGEKVEHSLLTVALEPDTPYEPTSLLDKIF